MSGDTFGCHYLGGEGATGIQWVETRDAATHPTIHRTDPTPKVFLVQNVSNVESEKLLQHRVF